MDITISYSFIELLKSPLLTLLWRACHHLLDRFPSGTGAADPPSTQSESALVLQCLLTGQGLQPQPAWGLPLTSLWFIQVFPRLEVPKLNTHPLARAPPAQGKALHLSLLTLAWLLLVYSPRLDSFRGTPTLKGIHQLLGLGVTYTLSGRALHHLLQVIDNNSSSAA